MGELAAGERLRLYSGEGVVTGLRLEVLAAPVKVYNFQVADHHTYFASPAKGEPFVWVHNASGYDDFTSELNLSTPASRKKLQRRLGTSGEDRAHHIIPLEMRDHELVRRAARGGFDINGTKNGIGLHDSVHNGSHGKFNSAVRNRLDRILEGNPNISEGDAARAIQNYVDQMRPGLSRLRRPLK